jgi:hypothetical protein
MSPVKARILRRLRTLPPERLEEVSAFVDLLMAECERDVALQKIRESAEGLESIAGQSTGCKSNERTVSGSAEERRITRPFNLSAVMWLTF